MPHTCPRCSHSNPTVARFCGRCGLILALGAGGLLGAGRAPHPQPLPPPEGFEPVTAAVNLHFSWEAAGGGAPLLGTETLQLNVFNAGYDLAEVVLRVRGTDESDRELFAIERELEDWPRGRPVRLEIPSYEVPDPVRALKVELVKAEFGAIEG